MTNRIVEAKELRIEFRRQVLLVCDFSQRKAKHILGIGSRQMTVDTGVEVFAKVKEAFEAAGRTFDKSLIHLHTPKGVRTYVSEQLGQMAKIHPVEGANAIETLWKTFGDLIPTARKKNHNVYVAKNGATAMEWASVADLRSGKTAAAVKRDEDLQAIVAKGREALGTRSTGEAYAQDCTEYFKALPAAE